MKRKRRKKHSANKFNRVHLNFVLLLIAVLVVSSGFYIQSNRNFDETKITDNSNTVSSESSDEEVDTLEGKVMVSFGDSVTEFGNYPDIVARNTGMTVHNIGLGGTRLSHHTDPYYDNFSLSKLIEAITNDNFSEQIETLEDENNTFSPKFKLHFNDLMEINFEEVDFISIFLGTNDYMGTIYGGSVPLGQESDSTRGTYYGALNQTINGIKNHFPDIKILLITPTWRMNNELLGGGGADEVPNSDGVFLVEYVDALISIGEEYSIPTLDLYRGSEIGQETKDFYLTDDVHPTDEGFEYIGNLISDFMDETYN